VLSADAFHWAPKDGDSVVPLAPDQALQGTALVAVGGRLVRIGGMSARNGRGGAEDLISTDSVTTFDPAANRWLPGRSLPETRSSHDAAADARHLIVAGGWSLRGAGQEPVWHQHALVRALDDADGAWEAIPQPFQRRACAVAIWRGEAYVVGGISPEGKPSRDVFIFNLSTREWRSGPALPMSGFGAALCVVEHGLLLGLMDGSLHLLESGSEEWRRVGATIFGRYFQRMVPMDGGRVAVVGGASRDGHFAHIEVLAVQTSTEPRSFISLRVPTEARTLNRQALVMNGNRLHFAGGNFSQGQHDFEPHHFSEERSTLSLASLKVTRDSDLPVKRQSMVPLVVGSGSRARTLMLGGFGHSGSGTRSFEGILASSLGGKTCDALTTSLPTALTQFGVAEHNGEIWVVGGLEYDSARPRGEAFRHQAAIYRGLYDSESQTLTFEPSTHALPEERRAFGYAQLGKHLYIAGGMKDGFAPVESFLRIDLETLKMETLSAPSARISPELVEHRGQLFLFGGSARGEEGATFKPCARLERYDPTSGQWTVVCEDVPVPPAHARMLSYRGSLLFVSTMEPGSVSLTFYKP
jgi:hypothetical protein